jgi:hypothetical protein
MSPKPLITLQLSSDMKSAVIVQQFAKITAEAKRLLIRKKQIQITVTEVKE